jgi:glutathione S-transferase
MAGDDGAPPGTASVGRAEITAFAEVPHFARGYVKDLRVRWALEEAGFPYDAGLLGGAAQPHEADGLWQPFGQVPAYRDAEVEMFESGAIVLHIASKTEALGPSDPQGRARTASWVFAALTSVQPYIDNYNFLRPLLAPDQRHVIDERLSARLEVLDQRLRGRDYLEDRFSAGDLMMATVVRELAKKRGKIFPAIYAYRQRCTDRPAFGRALDAQLASYSS